MTDLLKNLNKNEITVLYWKCKGLKHPQIAKKLGYSNDWVQLHVSNVYRKLGFDKTMHWTKRVEILEKEICPLLPKDLKEWDTRKEIPALEEPEIVTPDPEMMALVLYDEQQIEAVQNSSLTPPKPKETIIIKEKTKGQKTFSRFVFALITAIVLSFLGIFIYNLGRGATPAPIIIIVSPTPIPATDTPLPTATSAIPTDTPTTVPTNTQSPTFTPIPTQFIPPEDGILFEDTFDGTIKPEWTQNTGVWIVVDGSLTLSADKTLTYTDGYDWITLKDLGWNNYIVSVDVFIPRTNSNDPTAVVVRSSGSGEIGFATSYNPDLYMAFVGDGYNSAEAIASQRGAVDFPEGQSTRVEMEVQNDTYVLKFNGKEIQRITIPGYNKNLIQIAVHCSDSFNGCPSFDNFKVTYLP